MRLLIALVVLPCLLAETVVVAHKWDNSLGFYDDQTARLLTKISVGEKPHEMAAEPDRSRAYITNYGVNSWTQTEPGANTVTVVDLKARKVVGAIDLGRNTRPHGIHRGTSGKLYVTSDFPGALLVVDPRTGALERGISVGDVLPHMVAVDRAEQRAYTANSRNGSVSIIDLKNGTVLKRVDVGGVPMGIALTPAEDRVLVATRTGDAITVIDTKAQSKIAEWKVPGQPARLLVAPARREVLATTIGSGELVSLSLEDGKELRRLRIGEHAEGIALDPGGEFVYVSAQGENKVRKVSLPAWKIVQTFATSDRPDPILLVP